MGVRQCAYGRWNVALRTKPMVAEIVTLADFIV